MTTWLDEIEARLATDVAAVARVKIGSGQTFLTDANGALMAQLIGYQSPADTAALAAFISAAPADLRRLLAVAHAAEALLHDAQRTIWHYQQRGSGGQTAGPPPMQLGAARAIDAALRAAIAGSDDHE